MRKQGLHVLNTNGACIQNSEIYMSLLIEKLKDAFTSNCCEDNLASLLIYAVYLSEDCRGATFKTIGLT